MALRGTVWLPIALMALLAAACGGGGAADEPIANSTAPSPEFPYEAQFADYEPAPEPDGDLAKVVWPQYVMDASPLVKKLYEFQVTHGELMRYIPCFCGCGESSGHHNNRDCYIRRVRADGSVVFDPMAPT